MDRRAARESSPSSTLGVISNKKEKSTTEDKFQIFRPELFNTFGFDLIQPVFSSFKIKKIKEVNQSDEASSVSPIIDVASQVLHRSDIKNGNDMKSLKYYFSQT